VLQGAVAQGVKLSDLTANIGRNGSRPSWLNEILLNFFYYQDIARKLSQHAAMCVAASPPTDNSLSFLNGSFVTRPASASGS
jgi:hypothetical protein